MHTNLQEWFLRTLGIFLLGLMPAAGASAQVAGTPDQQGTSSLMGAIRTAWLLPPKEAQAYLESAHPTPAEFAVAAMVSHQTGLSLAAVGQEKNKRGSWTQVLSPMEGALHDTVFKGNPRYPLDSPPPSAEASPANCDARIVELAEVMTLERLTGESPAALAKKLGGEPFEALLSRAWQGEAPAGPKSPVGTERNRGEGGRDNHGPPGLPAGKDRPGEVRGWVGG